MHLPVKWYMHNYVYVVNPKLCVNHAYAYHVVVM